MFCLTSFHQREKITMVPHKSISSLVSYLQNNKFSGTIDVLADLPLTDL
jgi:hypothetical protein